MAYITNDQPVRTPPSGGAPPPNQLSVQPKPLAGTVTGGPTPNKFEFQATPGAGTIDPGTAAKDRLTTWLGSGNNPQLTKDQPLRGGRPAGQNPYLKLAGANRNRARLGRGMVGGNQFNKGLARSYQNFLGQQAGNQGNPNKRMMRQPRGRGFRDQFRRNPRPSVNRGDLMKRLRGVGRGGPWNNQLLPDNGQIGQPPPSRIQPMPPEYERPVLQGPGSMPAVDPVRNIQPYPNDMDAFTKYAG